MLRLGDAQRERFIDPLEYERCKGIYILTRSKLARAKENLLVMHPLPRVDEIAVDVDDDPRAVYFEQARPLSFMNRRRYSGMARSGGAMRKKRISLNFAMAAGER